MKRLYNVKSIVTLYGIIMMMILLHFETDQFASPFTHFCHILSKYSFIFGLHNKGSPLSALTQASTLVFLSLGSSLNCLSPPSVVQLPGSDKITCYFYFVIIKKLYLPLLPSIASFFSFKCSGQNDELTKNFLGLLQGMFKETIFNLVSLPSQEQ